MDDNLRKAAHEYHAPSDVQARSPSPPPKPSSPARSRACLHARRCLGVRDHRRIPGGSAHLTARGNLVAVITNGTACLGLGAIGPLASKPVMEARRWLFKKFRRHRRLRPRDRRTRSAEARRYHRQPRADVGGHQPGRLKAPEGFYVERNLRKRMKIPVFPRRSHGTAIIVGAAIVNGLKVVGKDIADVRLVVSGRGAARSRASTFWLRWACAVKTSSSPTSPGFVYRGRREEMSEGRRNTRSIPRRASWPK